MGYIYALCLEALIPKSYVATLLFLAFCAWLRYSGTSLLRTTLGPDIFGYFLLQYRGFPLSEVKNVLVTPFGTKIFVLIMEVFSVESLIRRAC